MKIGYLAASVVALTLLSACGGGSGGIGSTPTPVPTPTPTPTNATMTDLKFSQSFTNDAATLKGSWDLATGTAIDGTSKPGTLSIRYDAGSGSYALSTEARSDTFGASDVTGQNTYDTVYRRVDGARREILTLVKRPYTAQAGQQYVAMGFWQSNTIDNGRQSTEFTSFTYGLPTASGMVPRTGAGAYGVDLFGLVTMPGEEPMSFQGSGKFSVDFARGLFTTQVDSSETGLVTGKGRIGGGIELRAGGSLSSSAETFSGNAVYGSSYGQASGSIAGRFYGPNGEELGATFQTGNSVGMAAVGSIVGSRNAGQSPENQTLAGLNSQQHFYMRGEGGLIGSLTWLNSETFDYGAPVSDMVGGRFTVNDKIASRDVNFTTYAKTADNGYGPQQVELSLYKVGTANTELALTYASFGHWIGTRAGARQDYYFNYGFVTGSNFLAARTGKARYDGVLYGSGVNSDASARYDVKGTSRFDVDFGKQAFDGALVAVGSERTSGARADFGTFDVAGTLVARDSSLQGIVSRGGADLGNLTAQFYGHDAQELAATFYFNAPPGTGEAREVGIQGAIVAKRQ